MSEKTVSKIGIAIEPEVCMGAKCNAEGKVELIEHGFLAEHDFDEWEGYELEYAAGVNGFDNLLDAGVAVSDIGLAMRKIINNLYTSAKHIHAVIAMPSEYPMADHIDKFMKLQKILAPKDKDSQFSVETYDELELENLTSFDLVEKAAEQAGIDNYKVIMRPLAIAYAYEYEYPGCALREGERGLIYDWNKYYFSASIIEKVEGELEVFWSETIENPTQGNNAFLRHINEELAQREKECFEETMDVIHEMCGLSGFYMDTIDAVYVAGDFCDLPSVIFRLEDVFPHVFSMEDNRLAVLHGVTRLAQCLGEEELADTILEKSENAETDMKYTSEEVNFEDEEMVEEENTISLVPTLFKMSSSIISKNQDGIEMSLVRVYDDTIRDKYMQKGNVYNALLPYFETTRSEIYSYKGKNQIDFKLRKKPNNRMLMMKLIDKGESVSNYENECFAHAEFFAVPNKSKKGKIQLNYSLDAYEKIETLGENKYLIVDDQKKQIRYVFECWIEQLPMPGIDKGVYVYLDGSSNNDTNPEDIGAGYVVNIGTDVYFGHEDSNDSGRNVSAEYLAATNVFKNLPEMGTFASVTIYFDNINVGYVGAGLYHPDKSFGKNYISTFEAFKEKYPNTKVKFVHTDSHSYIFGNEMADQMAQGKEKDLMKLAKDFKENRDKICSRDGRFSDVMRFVKK